MRSLPTSSCFMHQHRHRNCQQHQRHQGVWPYEQLARHHRQQQCIFIANKIVITVRFAIVVCVSRATIMCTGLSLSAPPYLSLLSSRSPSPSQSIRYPILPGPHHHPFASPPTPRLLPGWAGSAGHRQHIGCMALVASCPRSFLIIGRIIVVVDPSHSNHIGRMALCAACSSPLPSQA